MESKFITWSIQIQATIRNKIDQRYAEATVTTNCKAGFEPVTELGFGEKETGLTRIITKGFETLASMTMDDIATALQVSLNRGRGEFVLCVEEPDLPSEPVNESSEDVNTLEAGSLPTTTLSTGSVGDDLPL